jgi:hypothetical protein
MLTHQLRQKLQILDCFPSYSAQISTIRHPNYISNRCRGQNSGWLLVAIPWHSHSVSSALKLDLVGLWEGVKALSICDLFSSKATQEILMHLPHTGVHTTNDRNLRRTFSYARPKYLTQRFDEPNLYNRLYYLTRVAGQQFLVQGTHPVQRNSEAGQDMLPQDSVGQSRALKVLQGNVGVKTRQEGTVRALQLRTAEFGK